MSAKTNQKINLSCPGPQPFQEKMRTEKDQRDLSTASMTVLIGLDQCNLCQNLCRRCQLVLGPLVPCFRNFSFGPIVLEKATFALISMDSRAGRVWNFAAGPAALPDSVLQDIQKVNVSTVVEMLGSPQFQRMRQINRWIEPPIVDIREDDPRSRRRSAKVDVSYLKRFFLSRFLDQILLYWMIKIDSCEL